MKTPIMRLILIIHQWPIWEREAALIIHERAKHFSIHRLFLLLKVQFIKCSAAAGCPAGTEVGLPDPEVSQRGCCFPVI